MAIFQETTCQQYVEAMTCLLEKAKSSPKYDKLSSDFKWWISRRQAEDSSERTSICDLTIAMINEQKTLVGWSCEKTVDTGWILKEGKTYHATVSATQHSSRFESPAYNTWYQVGRVMWELFVFIWFIALLVWWVRKLLWK